MVEDDLVATRRSLHALAELVLAGPQYAASGTIRLRVTPGGFGTRSAPEVRIDGAELVTPDARLPLAPTCSEVARSAGLEVRDLREVYAEAPDLGPDDPIRVDAEALATIVESFARGDAALRAFAPDQEPVLWPEHFDLGITVEEVNYGVSAGDDHMAVPYAYVGPWEPREGDFWNSDFGAARPITDLPDVAALAAFFSEGARHAADGS